MKHLLFVVLVLSLSACSTLQPQRKKANLAIDSEPSALPERPADETSSASSEEGEQTEGEIDLGFEGSSRGVRIERTMSEEDEEAALAAEESEDDEEEAEDESEEAEEEEEE